MKKFINRLKIINWLGLLFLPVWIVGSIMEATGYKIKKWFEINFE